MRLIVNCDQKEIVHPVPAFEILQVAENADNDWRYSIITQIIALYDESTLKECTDQLLLWARQPGSNECDFESLRILSKNNLVEDKILSDIARRNLFVYNIWIKETIDAVENSMYKFPLRDHALL